jgi:hypothetical protein
MTLTEDQQAEALRRIRRAVAQVERAEAERAEALEFARSVGVSVARIAEVANTTRAKVYGWASKPPTDPSP